MAAFPTWFLMFSIGFPKQRQNSRCSPHPVLLSLSLRQQKAMTDKSPKSQIICTSPCFFPDSYTLLVQFHAALLLLTALPHSTSLLSSFQLGSDLAGLRFASATLFSAAASHTSTTSQHHGLEPCSPLWQSHISKPCLAGVGRGQAATEDGAPRAGPCLYPPDRETKTECCASGACSSSFPLKPHPQQSCQWYGIATWSCQNSTELCPLSATRTGGYQMKRHGWLQIWEEYPECPAWSLFSPED